MEDEDIEIIDTQDDDGDDGEYPVRIVAMHADKGQEPIRIDKFLVNRIERVSRTKFKQAAEAGNLIVNGQSVKANYKVMPLDEIQVVMPMPVGHETLKPEDIPLDILYEDDQILFINKQAGMVVHPGVGNYTGTLVNALMFHSESLGRGQNVLQPGLVHRLDKDTSGVMVAAKTDLAVTNLARQFYEKTNKRRYVALVWGDVEEESGTITKNLGRDPNDRKRMTTFDDPDMGKHSVTHYKVLERFGYVTLIECILETGRTHQIRVHMASIGHPLFNDHRYGGNQIVKGTVFSKYKQFIDNCFAICPRQALHAIELGINHPTKEEWIDIKVDMPEDMTALIDKWRRYTENRLN